MSEAFLTSPVGDSIHNAFLGFNAFHIHLKKKKSKHLNSDSHDTSYCRGNINAITLLAGISETTVYTQDLLHMLCGFLSKGRLCLYRRP